MMTYQFRTSKLNLEQVTILIFIKNRRQKAVTIASISDSLADNGVGNQSLVSS